MNKKFLTTAAISAAILTGGTAAAATILPAYAQGTPQTQSPGTANAQQGKHPRIRKAAVGAVKTAADTIGIAPKDLATELKAGKSVADVATEHNVDPQKVIDAIVAKADARIDTAVQNGKLTQDKADKLKAKVPQLATKAVNAHKGDRQKGNAGTQSGLGTPNGANTPSSNAPTTDAPATTTAPAPATGTLGGDTTSQPSGSLTGN
jgi:hypothetical protein